MVDGAFIQVHGAAEVVENPTAFACCSVPVMLLRCYGQGTAVVENPAALSALFSAMLPPFMVTLPQPFSIPPPSYAVFPVYAAVV